MNILRTDNIKKADIRLISQYLKQGKVVVMPTDTIYGLSCVANKASSIRKIHKIKGSNIDKPLIVLISNLAMLRKIAFLDDAQEKYLKKIWFGKNQRPTTVLLRRKKNRLGVAAAQDEKIAVRLPNNELNYKIIAELGIPLVSTSLNRTGHLPLKNLKDLKEEFETLPDLVIDNGLMSKKKASRLIDISNIDKIKILRK